MKPFPAITRWLMLGMLWLGLLTPSPAKALGNASPRPASEYLCTGEQIDPDLGMYYLRARYYQPGLGRFWTIDSFEGDMEEPASLHKYLYCHGNPVNLVDPSGHMGLVSFSVSSIRNTMLSITIRATPLLNKATIIAFEAATGNTVLMGGGAAIGTAAAMSKIPGGLSAWTRLAQALDGAVVGPYQSMRSVLTRSGRNAHHINPTAVYPRIPRDTGAAVDLVGGGRGSEHNLFHASMRSFFRPFQPGGALYGQRPNNHRCGTPCVKPIGQQAGFWMTKSMSWLSSQKRSNARTDTGMVMAATYHEYLT